ncbi:MAG: cellulase family glycosylhydrolase [Bacteroidales bacterium]|nr:cellulase family glycosylhydrolase [Bacteroidales bacterium]
MIRKEIKILTIIILTLFYSLAGSSQAPFSRGVNLTGWFQVNSPGQIQFTKFTKQDIANIKSLGCDVIRLPINMHSMTSGSPSYTLDPLYVSFLDSVITWCEDLNIYLMIDNHTFDPNVDTSPDIGNILVKVWSQTASHLKDRSDYILYEILNEPHGISTAAWGTIQSQVITAIREKDTRHTIVVGGSGYNSYSELSTLPLYSDENLLYTFHFYDPFMFTHQGASWTVPSMEPLAGVPFPYNAVSMPVCPPSLRGTWIESSLNNYPSEGTMNHVKQLIDIAVNFRNNRNVRIFCGEFGVYIPNSNTADRNFWYESVRQYFEENNIPWTTWDYKGTFGLFNKNSNELFGHDLNVYLLKALNFNIPPQTPFSIKPDSAGFLIYSDYIGPQIYDVSSGSGKVNFYSGDMPNNDNYCLYWHGFSQYNSVGFDFNPDRDFSKLAEEGYALDFMVRGNLSGIKFDLRFLDTKTTEPNDHPWRMGTTIDETNVTWDRKWHHLNIPLSSLEEKGSWDNNIWYFPAGNFDWSAIDRFEISMEDAGTAGEQIWFDNIHITDQDTATVREFGEVGVENVRDQSPLNLKVIPNPVIYSATISYTLPAENHVSLSVYTLTGIKVCTLTDEIQEPGEKTVAWNGCNDNGTPLQKGIYICNLTTGNFHDYCKIIKYQ